MLVSVLQQSEKEWGGVIGWHGPPEVEGARGYSTGIAWD